jgi:hypothetical protein
MAKRLSKEAEVYVSRETASPEDIIDWVADAFSRSPFTCSSFKYPSGSDTPAPAK